MRRLFVLLLVPAFLGAAPAAPPTTTAEQAKRLEEESGEVHCRSTEQLTDCRSKESCLPGTFRSRGHTMKECEARVLKLCRELCEGIGRKPPVDSNRKCKCGAVAFDHDN